MRYYKKIEDGYIASVGTGHGGTEISAEEYSDLLNTIHGRPTPPEGKDYRLKESLEWEECDAPIVDPEATEEDYLAALAELGVSV